MTAPKRRTIDPKQKAQDALGVAQRRLAATEKKIVDLLGQAEALRPVKTAQAAEVAYLAQHPLLIERQPQAESVNVASSSRARS